MKVFCCNCGYVTENLEFSKDNFQKLIEKIESDGGKKGNSEEGTKSICPDCKQEDTLKINLES